MSKRNLLVTGGAGFIGTNFIRYVLEEMENWRVVNLDALTYAGNLTNFQDLSTSLENRHRFIHGDIRNESLLDHLFAEEKEPFASLRLA
jgi:dTDP-glucose 4,6-dehydratase